MTDSQGESELIDRSATHHGVPIDTLTALLALEKEFENFSVFGIKAEFSRRVARILDETSARPSA